MRLEVLSALLEREPSSDDLERIYRSLRLIRRAEEEIARIYPSDKIKSPVHLSIGQEAVVGRRLRGAASRRRGVADLSRPRRLPGQGRRAARACSPSCTARRPASPAARAARCTSSTCATTCWAPPPWSARRSPSPSAMRWRFKRTQSDARGRSAFFGDGATEEGVFAESLNFASLHKLPVLFVCENNYYAIHTPITQALGDQPPRASGWRPTASRRISIDDGDVLKLRELAAAAVARDAPRRGARRSSSAAPTAGASTSARTRTMIGLSRARRARSPGSRTTRWSASARMLAAEPRAPRSMPKSSAKSPTPSPSPRASPVPRNRQAAIHQCLRRRANQRAADLRRCAARGGWRRRCGAIRACFVFGLDVDDHKAIQGSTRGLVEEFGPERVFGTPLSEDAMTGVAIGAAMAGHAADPRAHPHGFPDAGMNQLINIAAKSRYMYGGQVKVPLVVRSMIGKSWGQGAQHSQGLHAMFMHVPGPEGGGAVQRLRRQGLPDRRDPRRQSGDLRRASPALLHRRLRSGGTLRRAVRQGARVHRRRRHHPGRHFQHAGRMPARARASRRHRHPRRGDRSDLAGPARHRDHRASRSRRPAGCSSSTTPGPAAAPAPRSSPRVAERAQNGKPIAGPAHGLCADHLPDHAGAGAGVLSGPGEDRASRPRHGAARRDGLAARSRARQACLSGRSSAGRSEAGPAAASDQSKTMFYELGSQHLGRRGDRRDPARDRLRPLHHGPQRRALSRRPSPPITDANTR